MEAIYGSRQYDVTIIRGVADYMNGTANQPWQPYASLSAAAVMKMLIEKLN